VEGGEVGDGEAGQDEGVHCLGLGAGDLVQAGLDQVTAAA